MDDMNAPPPAFGHAFGFARDWREDGFVVAYSPEDAAEGEAAIVAMVWFTLCVEGKKRERGGGGVGEGGIEVTR